MLPKKNRLNLALKNKTPNKHYTKVHGEDFILTFTKTQADFKAAVTISKKIAKKAVDRNRIKRITLEAIKELDIKNGNLTVSVRKNISTLKSPQVKQIIKGIINKKIHDIKTS